MHGEKGERILRCQLLVLERSITRSFFVPVAANFCCYFGDGKGSRWCRSWTSRASVPERKAQHISHVASRVMKTSPACNTSTLLQHDGSFSILLPGCFRRTGHWGSLARVHDRRRGSGRQQHFSPRLVINRRLSLRKKAPRSQSRVARSPSSTRCLSRGHHSCRTS